MNTRATQVLSLSLVFILIVFSLHAQEDVQNLAVVVNALGAVGSLSIIDLDEPDPRKAVQNKIIPLGVTPSDVQIQDGLAYVVNAFSHNVQIIDLRNRVSLGEIPIGDGAQPQRIAFIDKSKAYVACDGVNEIRVVDLKQRKVVNQIPGGLKPTGITVINGKAYVANPAFEVDPITYQVTYKDSSVTVIDTRTDAVLKTIPMPTNTVSVINDGEAKVIALSAGDFNLIPGYLSIINTLTDEVERTVQLRTTPELSLAIDSKGRIFINDGFLTNRGLMIYDLANQKWIRDRNDAIAELAGGSGLAVDLHDNLYIAFPDWTGGGQDVVRVMAPDETLIKTYRVGPGASIIAVAQIRPTEVVQGDLNGDSIVDVFDLVIVASRFGNRGDNIEGDVNKDGVVNVFDLVFIAFRFTGSVAAAPPRRAIPIAESADENIRRAIGALETYSQVSPMIDWIKHLLQGYLSTPTSAALKTQLFANYPNPFNPETWIPFQLSQASPVVIQLYDPSGRLIRRLELGMRQAGRYVTPSEAAFWDGKNEMGEFVTSGVYFYQLQTNHYTETRKMAVLK